jgi:hypothetical protein
MANIFSKSANNAPLKAGIAFALVVGAVLTFIYYYLNPAYMRVGYAPNQPVPFSHALHAGQLGIDCRYCHTSVDKSANASVPDVKTCMSCHSIVKTESPLLAPVREAYKKGESIRWTKVHQLPDYVYFNHSVHVNRGVSCVECHGPVNKLDVISQKKPLSMQFCLDCHRAPGKSLRPLNEVTNMDWKLPTVEQQKEAGSKFVHDWKVLPPQSCSGCHR